MRGIEMNFYGHLGGDVEKKESNGRPFLTFNVAVKDMKKDQNGQWQNETQWISCLWGSDGGNLLPYLVKGAMVLIKGRPHVRTYTDKNNNVVPVLECRVTDFTFLSSPRSEGQNQQPQQPQQPQQQMRQTPPMSQGMQNAVNMVQQAFGAIEEPLPF